MFLAKLVHKELRLINLYTALRLPLDSYRVKLAIKEASQ